MNLKGILIKVQNWWILMNGKNISSWDWNFLQNLSTYKESLSYKFPKSKYCANSCNNAIAKLEIEISNIMTVCKRFITFSRRQVAEVCREHEVGAVIILLYFQFCNRVFIWIRTIFRISNIYKIRILGTLADFVKSLHISTKKVSYLI